MVSPGRLKENITASNQAQARFDKSPEGMVNAGNFSMLHKSKKYIYFCMTFQLYTDL